MPNTPPLENPSWQQPVREEAGLREYVATIRERIWLIVGAVVACLIVAIAYLVVTDRTYEARADLLISPVPADDPLLASLGLLRQSTDPTRDIETAATLAETADVAELASAELDGADPKALLEAVSAEPVATSNIIAMSAEAGSAQEAADIANAMADAVVADRTQALREQVEQQLESSADSSVGPGLSATDRGRLETLANGPDPTIRVETEAQVPGGPISPNVRLTLAAALLGGLILGGVAAFGSQALDPRLRREEQLRARYKLPILARIPRESSRRGAPMAPGTMSQAAGEAFRTLRANLSSTSPRGPGSKAHTIMVTGSAPSEGKTTTAINLAASFALTGATVVLVEADLRRPAIANALGLSTPKQGGTAAALLGTVALEDALVTSGPFGDSLRLLLADYRGSAMGELFSLRAAERLLREVEAVADIVIIDSPPLTAVVDTLPLTHEVDDVLIVARLGTTRLDKLKELAEMLAGNGVTPTGFALIEVPRPEGGGYYFDEGRKSSDRGLTVRV